MPGQLKVDEIVDTAGTGPVTALNGLKADSLTNIAGTAGYPLMRLETAKTATGTSVDFTGIPGWAKKITVMLNGVSTNGTSIPVVRLGSGTVQTTGYKYSVMQIINSTTSLGSAANSSTGIILWASGWQAAYDLIGNITLVLVTGTTWSASAVLGSTGTVQGTTCAGNVALSGAIDRLQITTSNGTDAFDAGTINILIEGY